MDEATRSAESIQSDIRDLRNRFGVVVSDQQCDLCGQPTLIRQFYLFPCQHVFHDDCLATEVQRHRSESIVQSIDEIQKRIHAEKKKARSGNGNGSVKVRQKLKAELDRLIASECPFCGDIMIDVSNQLFIQPTEVELIESWKI